MQALEDIESQQNGYVVLLYNVDVGVVNISPKSIPAGKQFMSSIPIRVAAVHYCYNDAAIQPFMAITKLLIGKNLRLRFRTHFGEY
jgi:hypothetical protein